MSAQTTALAGGFHFSRLLAALLLLIIIVSDLPTTDAAPARERMVVVISVDGFGSQYLRDPRAKMPNLRKLARDGATADRMECAFPTLTRPNHTTLITGRSPGAHGVIGNEYLNRETGRIVECRPRTNYLEIVKAPTLMDAAKEAGLTTAGVAWPASAGSPSLDWTIPDLDFQGDFERASTPGLLEALQAEGISHKQRHTWKRSGLLGLRPRDRMRVAVAEHIIRKRRPNLLLLNLITLDSVQHVSGPRTDEAFAACAFIDEQIGRLIAAADEAGMTDNTTFLIVSDHGFVTFDKWICPNVLLKREGTLSANDARPAPGTAVCLAQGGAAFVYVADSADGRSLVPDLAAPLRKLEGVAAAFEPGDFAAYGHRPPDRNPREPDILLAARPGYCFNPIRSGDSTIIPVGAARGAHGHLPFHPGMQAAFIAAGTGVKRGGQTGAIRNLDVAPTIASLLRIEFPTAEGRVLREILKPARNGPAAK